MASLLSYQSITIALKDFLNLRLSAQKNEIHIKAALQWLQYAQDITKDGGVAGWYSFNSGWSSSYIETTGYIINTFLDCADYFDDQKLADRAIAMADFLLAMQLTDGGYRSVTPDRSSLSDPIVFDTAQDILGLTDIYRLTQNNKYLVSCLKAADFLCLIQEKNGSWIKFTYGNTVHTYHTRVAWALLKVYRISNDEKYKNAAIKNLNWAAENQLDNGWFCQNHLPPPNIPVPYTHTIAYAIEGFLFSGQLLHNRYYIDVAAKAAWVLLNYFLQHDFLPGTFNKNWQSGDKFTCLTGDAQISLVWLKLFVITKKKQYFVGAKKMNTFLKTMQDTLTTDKNIKGAIKGSFPIFGDLLKLRGYCRMAYLNWATKFFIDALLEEIKINNNNV